MSDDVIIDNPDQAPLRQRPIQQPKPAPIIQKQERSRESNKYDFLHDSVGIAYETCGRFEISERLDFCNYDLGHIHKLAISRQEDRVEHLTSILDSLMTNPVRETDTIENMLLEEFLETLIAIAIKFQGANHVHRWICSECQDDVDDKEKMASEQTIDLRTLNYVSIYEADDVAKELVKKKLERLSDSDFKNFLRAKFGHDEEKNRWSKEDYANSQEIKDGLKFTASNRKTYEFEFVKVKHLLRAKQIAEKNYEKGYKLLKKTKFDGHGSLADFKYEQELAIKKLREKQVEEVMLYHKALTLKSINGKELETDEQKLDEFKAIPPTDATEISSFLKKIKFGIVDERDYTCNLCGHTERGFLHQRSSPLEFLPESSDASGELRESSKEITFIGF